MNLDRLLPPLLAASLAVGIVVGYSLAVPHGAAFFVFGLCVLFLIAAILMRRGLTALASWCLFLCFAGILRTWLPPLSLIPDTLRLDGAEFSQALLGQLHAAQLSPTSESLVSAMLLGHREGLPPEVVQLYRLSGASHILALSGLHLGILFGVFNFCLLHVLLSRIRYVFGCLGIVLIWGFTLLVGFPVSLCRASLMMTLLIISQMTFSGENHWDIFGLTALLLLLINPAMLFDVGFQLSFGAVAGIFLFFGPLRSLLRPRHQLLNWLWQAWAVSFSAQIFTLPLLFHYFGYFSLTGVLLSPFYILLATCIIFSSLLLLLVMPWGIASLLRPLVEIFVAAQHALMALASSLPLSGMWVERLSWPSVLLVYFALLCSLPPLRALHPCEARPDHYHLAMFFRTWPYLITILLLLTVAYVIG